MHIYTYKKVTLIIALHVGDVQLARGRCIAAMTLPLNGTGQTKSARTTVHTNRTNIT